jgi:hypothetical protein
MLSDMAREVMPQEVTPDVGKGALGLSGHRSGAAPDSGPVKLVNAIKCRAMGKPLAPGVYVSQHLSLGGIGKTHRGKLGSPTGLGKTDRPG